MKKSVRLCSLAVCAVLLVSVSALAVSAATTVSYDKVFTQSQLLIVDSAAGNTLYRGSASALDMSSYYRFDFSPNLSSNINYEIRQYLYINDAISQYSTGDSFSLDFQFNPGGFGTSNITTDVTVTLITMDSDISFGVGKVDDASHLRISGSTVFTSAQEIVSVYIHYWIKLPNAFSSFATAVNKNITITSKYFNGSDAVYPAPDTSSVDEYTNIENQLQDSVSSGMSNAESLLNITSYLSSLAPAFTGVRRFFDNLAGISFFSVLIYISIAIGICGLIVNLVPSVASSISRNSRQTKQREGK